MPKVAKEKKAPKAPRAPSAYNIFIKSEIAKVKKENPGMNHKEVFAKAASNWKNSAQNPKNKKK